MGASKATFDRLQKLQNKALRICFCANRYTSNYDLHRQSNVLAVILRSKLDMYKIMYKRMLLIQSQTRNEFDDSREQIRPMTRYAAARPPIFEKPKTAKFVESVTYQGPKIWAELPNPLKSLNDFPTFDREFRKLIKDDFLTGSCI